MSSNFSPGRLATLACTLEVAAPKPGNVHRGADFEDVTLVDFLSTAAALGHAIDQNLGRPVGEMILAGVQESSRMAATNTNLGMVLLLCPLAKALSQSSESLDRDAIMTVLEQLNSEDCSAVYQAIDLAKPGGLGDSDEMDVRSTPPTDLVDAMKSASDRDLIARQFANGFTEVFDNVVPYLEAAVSKTNSLTEAIVVTHIRLMAQFPDSLIQRKCGAETAGQSAVMAGKAIDAFDQALSAEELESTFWSRVSDLDLWLRSDGHRRNPGTTADMIAAGLFVALANGTIVPPF